MEIVQILDRYENILNYISDIKNKSEAVPNSDELRLIEIELIALRDIVQALHLTDCHSCQTSDHYLSGGTVI